MTITDADRVAARDFIASWPRHGFATHIEPALAESFAAHRLAGVLAGRESMQEEAALAPQRVRPIIGASEMQTMALSYAEAEIRTIPLDMKDKP